MNDAGILWEAEILLEEAIRTHAALPPGTSIDAAAKAVADMRAAVASGQPADPAALSALGHALAALSAAVGNKTARGIALGTDDPSLRARIVRLGPSLLRSAVSIGMFLAFFALLFAFIGFGILTGALRDIRETNEAINALVQKAPKPGQADYCSMLAGHNYQTNLLKSRILVDYATAAHTIKIMRIPLAMLVDRTTLMPAVELYPTDPAKDCAQGAATTMAQARAQCETRNNAVDQINFDCDLETTEQYALDILRIYEMVLLPMLFALFGVLIAIERKISRLTRSRPFLPADAKGCVASICAALFVGAFLSQILPAIQGDMLPSKLPPFALAFAVGFNIDSILEALGAPLSPKRA